jgi:hypothetical protein
MPQRIGPGMTGILTHRLVCIEYVRRQRSYGYSGHAKIDEVVFCLLFHF